jgi:fructokinase
MFDVIAIGELLIDFTPAQINGESAFLPKPGGAPANVAAQVSRLGGSSAFIGKVGGDQFGHFLQGVLNSENVDTTGLMFDKTAPTTLAFVHLDENGERSFSFYRKHCADTRLCATDLNLPQFWRSKILHFGSVSLTDSPAKETVIFAAEYASKNGVVVSFDPNYRPLLWNSEAEAVTAIRVGLELADIVKVSQEEMTLITNCDDLLDGSAALSEYGARLVVVTLGANGAFFRYDEHTAQIPSACAKVVDTNGAGDAFFGGLLYQLTRFDSPLKLPFAEMENAVRFANAVGALTTTKHGAIPALPTLKDVIAFTKG